jgi:transketolase
LNVKMVGAYSGILTGKTGKTHQTIEDMAVFRAMPYVTTIVPVDGLEVRLAMKAIVEHEGPVYFRLTRDPCPVVMPENYEFKIGQAVVLREGGDVTLIGTGQKTIDCLEAADQLKTRGIGATVLHVPTLKPLDEKAIIQAASKTGRVVTVEEHSIIGGLGGAVAEVLVENCPLPMKRVGCRDTFAESGANEDLLEKYGLTPRHVIQTVHEVLEFGK